MKIEKETYRDPLLIERYEDVIFELDQEIKMPQGNNSQNRVEHNFSIDNSGELPPLDWYNARFSVDFKLQQMDGSAIHAADGIVNSVFSLISNLKVLINGINVYDCSDANLATHFKNLLEYSPGYIQSQGTNLFYYIDKNRNKQTDKTHADYNSGFAVRRLLLADNHTVNAEIPLNRYSFFEGLEDQILPNSKIEIKIKIETDKNLSWKVTNDNRVVITKFQLIVPRITFNSKGSELYLKTYLIPRKWNYLQEVIYSSDATQQKTGSYRISTGIDKPRHVFVFMLSVGQLDNELNNKFMFDSNNLPGGAKLDNCYLEVGHGKRYPETDYTPQTEKTRVFRDVLKYVNGVNEYDHGTLLNRHNFENIFPFIYFDLTNQPTAIRNGLTKLVFKYKLSAATTADYKIYALVLNEQDIETKMMSNKLVISSM